MLIRAWTNCTCYNLLTSFIRGSRQNNVTVLSLFNFRRTHIQTSCQTNRVTQLKNRAENSAKTSINYQLPVGVIVPILQLWQMSTRLVYCSRVNHHHHHSHHHHRTYSYEDSSQHLPRRCTSQPPHQPSVNTHARQALATSTVNKHLQSQKHVKLTMKRATVTSLSLHWHCQDYKSLCIAVIVCATHRLNTAFHQWYC